MDTVSPQALGVDIEYPLWSNTLSAKSVLGGRVALTLTRSEDVVHRMEAQGQGDLAAVLMKNLAISQGLRAVDALLLALCVWEVWNFELWEQLRVAEEVLVQDRVVDKEQDCFRGIAK